MITLEIPVPSHVKKFLTFMYGEKYFLNINDTLGKAIHGLLQKKMIGGQINPTFPLTYPIKISLSKSEKEGCIIQRNNLMLISQYCDKYFRDMVFFYALMRIKSGKEKNTKEGLREALLVFNINEEDIAFESIYRDFKRKQNTMPFSQLLEEKNKKKQDNKNLTAPLSLF